MTTDRKSASEIRALWHLQSALLGLDYPDGVPSADRPAVYTRELKRAEHIRHILQSGGATEPERLARALERLAETLKA